MTTVRRLQAAAAFSAAVFAATCWQIGGVQSRNLPTNAMARNVAIPATLNPLGGDPSGLFASRPVITFKGAAGDNYFALQLQPKLADTAVLPRDLIVVIDTSASQVGLPLQNARKITEQLVQLAGPNDRIAIWTVNTPEENKSLTSGLVAAKDAKVADALTQLEKVIYAAGATDLKDGMKKVLSSITPRDDRRATVIYLGDGDSVLNPVSEAERNKIAGDLVDRKVTFLPVPLGIRLNSKTIHGLAHATGGAVIRFQNNDQPVDTAKHLLKSIDAPVLYPTKAEFSNVVSDVMPSRLPPLRGDLPTLVAGQFKGGDKISCVVEGTVNGKTVRMTISEAAPASESTNYFLGNLVRQWREADRSAPAVLRADRGLALAYEQTRLAREEFLTQANWALGVNKLDAASGLFQAAKTLDPNDAEAAAGMQIVDKIKSGAATREQIMKETGEKIDNLVKALHAMQEQPAATVRPGTEPASGPGLLDLEKRRRAVQEQQVTQIVDEAVRQARQMVNSDPDAAYDLLKRQLGSIRDNGDLSESVRSTLGNRLEAALRTVQAEGAKVKLKQDIDLQTRIAVETRRNAEAARSGEEEKIRQRVKIIGEQMDRARYEEAYKEALELQRELTARGRRIPPAVHLAYGMNTNAAAIRDYEELRRVKEERYLLTMLQVDKSHVPFPDEPPVAFPAASFWKEISELRKDRYVTEELGSFSRKAIELKAKLARPITSERSFDGVPLKDFLEFISDRYEMTILINQVPFREAMGDTKIEEQTVRIPKMPGVSLSTLMGYALAQVNATFIIRRDYIEVTTRKAAGYEKTVKAYPVADLVIPIPNAVDPASLNQNLQVLGNSLSANGQAIFGSAGGGLNFGNFGIVGGAGFVPGGIGGGFGALGQGGGQQAFLGQGGGGAQGGALGFAGGTNQTNLGVGGGVLGFGGGQQGQFGNLGGQFGIQGGDTSNILIQLIQDTIAPKEWNTRAAQYLQQSTLQHNDDDAPPLDITLLNSLGYYQPSRALVVRASSRVHNRVGDFSSPTAGGLGAANKMDRGGDVIVFEPGKKKDAAVAAVAKKPEPVKKVEPEATVKNPNRDPKKVWQEHMAQGHFRPRNVIAVADLLAHCEKFEDVVELLKADLRHGVLAHACVYDALAAALAGTGASVEEIERVRLSKIDMDPENADNFIEVARAMAEMGRHDRVSEYCHRASALEPNSSEPYRQALVLAQKAGVEGNATALWAATNLLQREWVNDAAVIQQLAKSAVEQVAGQMEKDGRSAEAARIRADLVRNRQRDLVVDMIWADQADLDLTTHEPVGTICSPQMQRTPAGGIWSGDRLGSTTESYTAAKAYNGSYEFKICRVWGQPMGNKVNLKVTRHQGTPQENVEFHTLVLDSNGEASFKLSMLDGRRTESESVPSECTVRRLPNNRAQSQDEVYQMLRSMADPMLAAARPGVKGGTSASNSMGESSRANMTMTPGVELSHQTKINPALTSGIDLLTSTTISADRSTMKISMTPAFQTGTIHPRVPIAAVPGGK